MAEGNTQDAGFVSLSFSPPAAANGNLSPNFLPCALIAGDAIQRIKRLGSAHGFSIQFIYFSSQRSQIIMIYV
jgi:hypothetical protein